MVPHDRLILEGLERNLKREKMGTEPTTHIANASVYYPSKSFYEQVARDIEDELNAAVRRIVEQAGSDPARQERQRKQQRVLPRVRAPPGVPSLPARCALLHSGILAHPLSRATMPSRSRRTTRALPRPARALRVVLLSGKRCLRPG